MTATDLALLAPLDRELYDYPPAIHGVVARLAAIEAKYATDLDSAIHFGAMADEAAKRAGGAGMAAAIDYIDGFADSLRGEP